MPSLHLRRIRGPFGLVGLLAAVAVIVGAQAPQVDPAPLDQQTARIVAALLEQGHLSKPEIDDEVAKAWARNYIKSLDPQKSYFLKADVDGFLAKDTTLDDAVRRGKLDFAVDVFKVFLKRHDERLATITGLLKEKPDFTVDETFVDDPEKTDYPKTDAEAVDLWRKRIKLERLILKAAKETDEDAVKQLTVRYRDRNRFWHQVDNTELLEIFLSSLTTSIDPHSSYLSQRNWEDMLNQQLHLTLEGIGARLRSEDGYAVVEEVVPGGAADKDGRLGAEDKILGLVKENGETVDFVEKKLNDVVRFIRGPRGTKVKLVVQPAESKERKVYELTREKIELVDQHAKGQILETKAADGRALKLGVISLPAFYGDSAAVLNGEPDAVSATLDCRKILSDFKAKKVNAVVVDLRGNGGGLLTEAVSLSGLFINSGPVVQIRQADGIRHMDDEDDGTSWDGPLTVLIDKGSASASEIFAGVIQDYGRGLIVGDSSTFGKGTVQSIIPINEQLSRRDIPGLGALKLTIQQFYRANGASTQIKGVQPDVHIPSARDQAEYGEGKMEHAIKFDRIEALPHDMFNRVPADLVAQLQARSDQRRTASEKFQKEEARIKKILARKNKPISLNEAKFREEFVADEDDADDDKPKGKKKRPRSSEAMEWKSDFYNDEILAIIGDYLTLGSKALASAPQRVVPQP